MKILIMISLALATILTGCNKVYNDTYIVINNTSKQVKIKGFNLKYDGVPYNEIIDIQSNSKFTVGKGKGEEYQSPGIFSSGGIDSVCIIFANKKIIKYRCNTTQGQTLCDDVRNILNYNKYYEQVKGEHESTYTYTITEADYESADTIK